jgi:hypothetical protein
VFDYRARLEAARDRLADAIDTCESNRDLPSLVREYRATLEALAGMADATEVDPVDQLAAKRANRRSAV